jgi:hypothetical protein
MIIYGVFLYRIIFFIIVSLLYLAKYKWEVLTRIALWSVNFHTKRNPENQRRFHQFKKKPNGILLFTHATSFDHFIIHNEFEDVCAGIALKSNMIYPFDKVLQDVGCILFEKGNNTVELVKQKVKERRGGDNVFGMAPAGGYTVPDDQNKLTDFKMGAFLPMTHFLPILIKTDPYIHWDKGQSILSFLFECLTHPERIFFSVKVLDEINPLHDETPEEYRDRTKLIMEEGMRNFDIQTERQNYEKEVYQGHPMLLLSSILCFLIPALIGFYHKRYITSILTLIVLITSIWYNLTGNHHGEYVDMITGRIVGITLILMCLFKKMYIPPFLAIFAFLSFAYESYITQSHNNFKHVLLIHIPIFIAFLLIAYQYPIQE